MCERHFELTTTIFSDLSDSEDPERTQEKLRRIFESPRTQRTVFSCIESALDQLPLRDSQLLRLKYGLGCDPHSYCAVGLKLSPPITGSRVGDAVKEVLFKLVNTDPASELFQYFSSEGAFSHLSQVDTKIWVDRIRMRELLKRYRDNAGLVPLTDDELEQINVETLPVGTRSRNVFKSERVWTILDLISLPYGSIRGQLLRMPNFGTKSLVELELVVSRFGVRLT